MFPAYAGVSRDAALVVYQRAGVPRLRGGESKMVVVNLGGGVCSPPTRG